MADKDNTRFPGYRPPFTLDLRPEQFKAWRSKVEAAVRNGDEFIVEYDVLAGTPVTYVTRTKTAVRELE